MPHSIAWVDDDGVVLVESVWWVDGTLAQFETTASRDEVGEGWLVLATERAMRELQAMFPGMRRREFVERGYQVGGGKANTKHCFREDLI